MDRETPQRVYGLTIRLPSKEAADLYIPDVKALWRDPQRALGLGG